MLKIQNSTRMLFAFLLLHTQTVNFAQQNLVYFATHCLVSRIPLMEGRAGTGWWPSEQSALYVAPVTVPHHFFLFFFALPSLQRVNFLDLLIVIFGEQTGALGFTCLWKQSNVYWTVHHCNSWRIKDQLDVTCYFISLLICSTCFGH